jgi:hypothetical protein
MYQSKMKLTKIALAFLLINLVGCSYLVRKPDVVIKQVEKPKLELELPEPIELDSIRLIVITEENVNDVIAAQKNRRGLVFLVALDEEGYKTLAINNAKILKYIKEQKALLIAYKKYYENY